MMPCNRSCLCVGEMPPMDQDDPFYDMVHCDPYLDCAANIEANVFASRIQNTRVELCCHCVGECDSPAELKSSLKAPNDPCFVVHHVCIMYLGNGCHIIVCGERKK